VKRKKYPAGSIWKQPDHTRIVNEHLIEYDGYLIQALSDAIADRWRGLLRKAYICLELAILESDGDVICVESTDQVVGLLSTELDAMNLVRVEVE